MFDTFPMLNTPRLHLREVTQDDAEAALGIYGDDRVMRWHGKKALPTLAAVEGLIEDWFITPFRLKRGIRFGISLGEDPQFIGSCGFWRWEQEHFKAEIGYELHPAYHKQGIMQEALSEMIRFGFTTMNLNRIEARTDAFNLSSQKTIASLNFKLEGVQRQAEYEDDHFVDMLLYGLLKEDWSIA